MALSSNGFVASDLTGAPELPIFTVDPVQLAFSIAADFVAAQVANNVLVLALSTGRILRIDLERPEDIDGMIQPISHFKPLYLGKQYTVLKHDPGTDCTILYTQISTFPRDPPKQASSAACLLTPPPPTSLYAPL